MPDELMCPRASLAPETILETVSDELGVVGYVTVADVVRDAHGWDEETGAMAAAAAAAGDHKLLLEMAEGFGTGPSELRAGFAGGFVHATRGLATADRLRAGRRRRSRTRPRGHRVRRRGTARRGPPRRRPDPEPLDRTYRR